MLIFDQFTQPIIIDNIFTPTAVEYFWVLDLNILDFKLTPLIVLEEIISPSLEIMINGFKFWLPSNWNILIVDEESTILDTVEVSEVGGREFRALVYGPNQSMASSGIITVTNYRSSYTNVGPALNKHQMLCHPIYSDTWINVSSSDTYSKYLKDKIVGDLI